jgi:hypothetical protein
MQTPSPVRIGEPDQQTFRERLVSGSRSVVIVLPTHGGFNLWRHYILGLWACQYPSHKRFIRTGAGSEAPSVPERR